MPEGSKTGISGGWTDRFGAVASTLCALHCAVCALAPAALGAMGLGVLLSQSAELGLSLIAILFGLGALTFAWRLQRSRRIVGLLAMGIIGLVISRGIEMGGAHDDHHAEDEHHEEEEPHDEADDHKEVSDHEDADEHGHEDEHADGEIMHSIGAAIGVLAGLSLLFGHLLNLRATRRTRNESNINV